MRQAPFQAHLDARRPLDLKQRLAWARDPAYWEGLRTSGVDEVPPSPPGRAGPTVAADLERRGLAAARGVAPTVDVAEALRRVEDVEREGWPAVFAWVYDEPWRLLAGDGVGAVLSEALGQGWAWHPGVWVHAVQARAGARGWPPHADEPASPARHDDGRPTKLSAWLALTPATAGNGAMVALDAEAHPALGRRLAADEAFTAAELAEALHAAEVLEAAPGDLWLWRMDVVHWGGPRTDLDAPRRVALTFEAASARFVDDKLRIPYGTLPPLDRRLWIVGYALSAYARAEREPWAYRFAPLADELMR